MDSLWIALAMPIVKEVIAYLRDQAVPKAGEEAVKKIGEKTGETLLDGMKALFRKKGDAKAEKALAAVEDDPGDTDYEQKLLKEVVRVAEADPQFANALQVLEKVRNAATPGQREHALQLFNQTLNLIQINSPTTIININPPTSDAPARRPDERLLHDYICDLYQSCDELPFGDPQRDKGRAMEMAEVFTMLRVQRAEESSPDSIQRRGRLGREPELPSVIAALARERACVLVGVPGGGKSTVVAFLALALAEAQPSFPHAAENGGLARLGAAWRAGARLPVRVILRNVTDTLWEGVPELQRPELNAVERAALIALLEQRLLDGTALLLLDGLDEVATTRLAALHRLLDDALVRFGKSRIVITCRTFDYQNEPERRIAGLPELHLQPFNEAEQRLFVDRWYRELSRKRSWSAAEVQAKHDDLLLAIRERAEIAELAETPLLLSMIALVHNEEGTLPAARAVLYHRCVRLLLTRWRTESAVVIPEQRLLTLAAELGYRAHAEEQRQGQAFRGLEREQINVIARDLFLRSVQDRSEAEQRQAEDQATAAARRLRDSNGLLLAVGGNRYNFAHRTLKEFLAGEYLSAGSRRNQTLAYAADPWWRVAFVLMAGYHGREGNLDYMLTLIEKLLARGQDEQLLAAEMLAEIGRETLFDKGYAHVFVADGLWTQTAARLRALAFDPAACPDPAQRNRAATLLDRLGADNRPELELSHPDYWAAEIQPGSFRMGEGKAAFTYHIRYRYRLARFPVTNRQYADYLATLPPEEAEQRRPRYWPGNRYRAGEGNHPVVGVSWHDATAFAGWVNDTCLSPEQRAGGEQISLPTEPEWERAAAYPVRIERDGERREYPWGAWEDPYPSFHAAGERGRGRDGHLTDAPDDSILMRANTNESGIGGTSAVGIFPHGVAACGAHDLAGNVWEWCATPYQPYPLPEDVHPEMLDNTDNGRTYVLRGGSWYGTRDYARCAYRNSGHPVSFSVRYGFRLARRSPT